MRVAVVLGCNIYESPTLDQLAAAELDAMSIFEALVDEAHGGYSKEHSKLLLSPKISDVRAALEVALVDSGQLDTFTFFFAGHGGVGGGSYYMFARDTRENKLAFSGLSLSDLFRMIADANPSQANIVIDACEAGGLISDLSTVLKPELIGDAQTLSITLLATAAQNEIAEEDSVGGLGTQIVVKCIRGEELVQEHSPMLDLMDVGRHVAARMKGTNQTPVVWGLNLSSTSQFAKNHFYSQEATSSVRVMVREWEAKAERSLQEHAKSLWDLHSSVDSDWNPSRARTTLQEVYAALSDEPSFLVGFVRRLRSSLMARAETSPDLSRPIEVLATLSVTLLQHLNGVVVAQLIEEMMGEICALISSMIDQLVLDIRGDQYALLEEGAGIANLFALPIRLTKIMAWTAFPVLHLDSEAPAYELARTQFERVVDVLLQNYLRSITPVSDLQAPGWCLLLAGLRRAGLASQEEAVIGHMFYRFVQTKGRVLRVDATGDEILKYLVAVDINTYSFAEHLIERPPESLTVAMRCAFLAGMQDVIDIDLWRLDGCSFMAYVPENYASFDDSIVSGGCNYEWQIGNQICRLDEFGGSWPDVPVPESPTQRALCMMASLLFPDRVAWFCLSGGQNSGGSATAVAKEAVQIRGDTVYELSQHGTLAVKEIFKGKN